MPARRRKKQRIRLKPAPFLWIGLTINVWLGVQYSPMTNLRRVVVEGSHSEDQGALKESVLRWKGIPCLGINPRAIESDALMISDVVSASLSRNIFGTGRLVVKYREPAMVLTENHAIGITLEGVMYPMNVDRDDLPTLALTYFPRPSFSLFSSYEAATMAKLARDSSQVFPQSRLGIVVDESGTLCLNVDGVLCIFGTSQNLSSKLSAAKSQLSADILRQASGVTINLMDPKNPVVRGLRKQ